jgi:hypothetical protein
MLTKISDAFGFGASRYSKATINIKTSQMESIKKIQSVKGGK